MILKNLRSSRKRSLDGGTTMKLPNKIIIMSPTQVLMHLLFTVLTLGLVQFVSATTFYCENAFDGYSTSANPLSTLHGNKTDCNFLADGNSTNVFVGHMTHHESSSSFAASTFGYYHQTVLETPIANPLRFGVANGGVNPAKKSYLVTVILGAAARIESYKILCGGNQQFKMYSNTQTGTPNEWFIYDTQGKLLDSRSSMCNRFTVYTPSAVSVGINTMLSL